MPRGYFTLERALHWTRLLHCEYSIMRSRLLFFCLVAATAAAAQKVDSKPADTQAVPVPVLLTFDQLNAMTNEQRTAYANTFDAANSESKVENVEIPAQVDLDKSYVPAESNLGNTYVTASSYNRGESGYKNLDNGYISEITGFRSDRGYSTTIRPSSYGSNVYGSGNGQWRNGYNSGIGIDRSKGEKGYGRGDIGDRNREYGYGRGEIGENGYDRDENGYRRGEEEYGNRSGYKDDNMPSGPYGYGYDDGHKSARGYSDSLPKDYPYRIIGLHGFVFEKRYSRASGLMNPITPKALSHLGYRQKKKDEVFVPPY